MKHLTILLAVVIALPALCQTKIPKNANRFVYQQVEYGESIDTSFITVIRNGNTIEIETAKSEGTLIPGYASESTYVDYDADSITVVASFTDGTSYYYRRGLSRNDIEWTVEGPLHKCSINSNSLVFDMDETTNINVNPLPHYGLTSGVLRSFSRNGQTLLKLVKAECNKKLKT